MEWICDQRLAPNLCQICANTLVLINNIQKWDSNAIFCCKTSVLMRGYLLIFTPNLLFVQSKREWRRQKRWNCSGSMSACCTVVGCSGSTATCGIRDSLAGSLTSYNKLPTEVGERWSTWPHGEQHCTSPLCYMCCNCCNGWRGVLCFFLIILRCECTFWLFVFQVDSIICSDTNLLSSSLFVNCRHGNRVSQTFWNLVW